MQKMILIPADQYDLMLRSYDRAMEELHQIRELMESMNVLDDVVRQLKLYELMDKHDCDMDTAELLLEDQEADGTV